MSRATIAAMIGAGLLLAVLLACGAFGLAVREGVASEAVVWFPPGTRYQIVLRVGSDALPWERRRTLNTAVNLWVHGRGTDWHIVRLVRVPLGSSERQSE